MSEYGRLYEEVSQIRAQLSAIRRVRKTDISTADRLIETNRLEDARASVLRLKGELESLLYRWEKLEEKMEKAT